MPTAAASSCTCRSGATFFTATGCGAVVGRGVGAGAIGAVVVICTEAGLSLDATLKRVSEEFGAACSALADELALTGLELGFLPDRRQALRNLDLRTNIPGVRGMVNNLLQADKYGTPIAQALRVLSAEFREERMLKAEEKAARLPAMLTVPMIIFILPPLFVVLLGPAVLRTIDALSPVL